MRWDERWSREAVPVPLRSLSCLGWSRAEGGFALWAKTIWWFCFTIRGYSITMWTEFCHFLTPPPSLLGQFLYPEHGQKRYFWSPPPHLVHIVIECPHIGFGYFRVQNDYVTDKFPKVIPAWPVAGYAICEIPVVCSSYAKIAKHSCPTSASENYGRFHQILSRNYAVVFLSKVQI